MEKPTDKLAEQLRELLAAGVDLTKAEQGCIIVRYDETDLPEVYASHNYLNIHSKQFESSVRAALFRYVIDKGPLEMVNDLSKYRRIGVHVDEFNLNYAVRPTISITIPLRHENGFIGILYLEKFVRLGVMPGFFDNVPSLRNLAAQKGLF